MLRHVKTRCVETERCSKCSTSAVNIFEQAVLWLAVLISAYIQSLRTSIAVCFKMRSNAQPTKLTRGIKKICLIYILIKDTQTRSLLQRTLLYLYLSNRDCCKCFFITPKEHNSFTTDCLFNSYQCNASGADVTHCQELDDWDTMQDARDMPSTFLHVGSCSDVIAPLLISDDCSRVSNYLRTGFLTGKRYLECKLFIERARVSFIVSFPNTPWARSSFLYLRIAVQPCGSDFPPTLCWLSP